MIDVAVMVEGQNGINWPRWQRIARTTEDAGFVGLFRSDHIVGHDGERQDALEMFASLTWLASHTSRIVFGPLVSPISFRDPRMLAWMGSAIDDLSGGRLRLGLGAGWQEREHASFGYELLGLARRFQRFEEGLEVITRLLRSDEPVTFEGEFFRLRDALVTPRPTRPGGPPIIIGGKGPRRTLPLVARYADEWNAVAAALPTYRELTAELDRHVRAAGRQPGDILRSFMTTVVYGRTDAELRDRLKGQTIDDVRAQNRIVGTASRIVDQLHELHALGIERVMLRWEDFDDMAGLEALGRAIVPRLGG